MIYYYLIFAWSLLLGFIFKKRKEPLLSSTNQRQLVIKKRFDKEYVFLVLILCFLLIGFRDISVGFDTANYVNNTFNSAKYQGTFVNNQEIVISLIARFSMLFSSDYRLFLVLYAAIIVFLYGYFITQNSNNMLISISIFLGMFFVPSMNLMREWLAIGFGINAIYFLKNKRYFLYLVLLLLSIFSHVTAVCFLLVSFVFVVKNKRILFIAVLLICSSIFLLRNQIVDIVISFVPKYAVYSYSDRFLNDGGFNVKDLVFLGIIILYSFTLIAKENLTEKQKNDILTYLCLVIIALTFSLCGGRFNIMHRLVYYFSVYLIISLPLVISFYDNKRLIYAFVILAMLVMLFRNQISDNNGISNYLFFWQSTIR